MRSPDHSPSGSSSKKFDFEQKDKLVFSFLSPEGVAELRKKQNEIIENGRAALGFGALDQAEVDAADAESYKKFGDLRDEYLKEFGIADDDPNKANYNRFLEKYSVDNMSNQDWNVGTPTASGDPATSGREKATAAYNAVVNGAYQENADFDEAHPEWKEKSEKATKEKEEAEKAAAERDKKIEELEKKLEKVKGLKHSAYARRMLVGWAKFKKRKAAQAEYDKAEADYHAVLADLESHRTDKHEAELAEAGFLGSREEEVNDELAKRINALMDSDDEAQKDEVLRVGGWKVKTKEKIANMSRRGKLVFTIGAAAIGITATIATGGVGGGLGVLLAGGLGLGKATKGYFLASSRMFKEKQTDGPRFVLTDKKVDRKEAIRLGLEQMKADSAKDIEDGDKKKRNAVFVGLGTAALGSAATLGVGGYLTNFIKKPFGVPGGLVGDMLDGSDSVPTPEKPDIPSWSLDTSDMAPSTPSVSPEMIPTDMGLRDSAGLYEQFGKIPGIEKEHYHDLWKAVGPELAAQVDNGYGQPFAYEMNGIPGNWGIRMTPDHQMPQEAVDIITSKYQEMFGTPTGAGGVSEAMQNSDAVTLTEADARGLENVVKMDTITPEAVAEQTGLMEKLSYATPNLSAERFAQHIGLPTSAWEGQGGLQEYMTTQIEGGNRLYADYFYVGGDGGVRFTGYGDKLNPDTVADMLQHIPNRNSFTLAG
jgi:hypothetical protein